MINDYTPSSAHGILKKLEIWDFRNEMHLPEEQRIGKKIYERGPQHNMITNLGLRGWVTRAFCENFIICAAGEGVTQDTRYPTFTLTAGTNIGTRTGNAVKITGTTNTALFSRGDILHYVNPALGDFVILSRTVNGSDLDLVLLNADGSDPTGTTTAASQFFIYRTSQIGLQTEVGRAGTPSAAGSSPAAQSEGSGFISGNTDGPISAGSGVTATATIASGLVTSVNVTNPGLNFVEYAPPTVVLSGGSAGQFITGNVTSTPSDGGTITDGGSAYSDTPGDVTIEITGPGRHATFVCTVSGGVITTINVTAAGEGYFGDAYSTAENTVEIIDATGSGAGAEVTFTPRRQAKAVSYVSGGGVSAVRVTDPGYKLLAAPSVIFTNTSYLVHERTFAFAIQVSDQDYGEVGFSNSISPGDNLFSRILLRNTLTGASDPVTVLTGQQLRVTYQVILGCAPSVATTQNSSLVGGWGLQGGKNRMERLGMSCVNPNCSTFWMDEGYHLNEPYFYQFSQMGEFNGGPVPDTGVNNPVQVWISDSFAAQGGAWGTQVNRSGGEWAARGVPAPEIEYADDDPTLYPIRITKTANYSIAAGNGSLGTGLAIGSYGVGLTSFGITPTIKAIGYSYVFDAAARGQASGDGKPEKQDTNTLALSEGYNIGRTLAV